MRHALPTALLFTSLAAPLAHAQCTPIPLIFNGDFELPAITNNTFQPFTPTGWTWAPTNGLIFRGQPAPIWPVAASGSQYVDIGNAGTYVLRQSFTLTDTRRVNIRWKASAATGANSSPYTVTLRDSNGLDYLTESYSAAGPYPSGQSWKSEEPVLRPFLFAGSYTLEFRATGVVGGFDTLIDSVSVEAQRQAEVSSGGFGDAALPGGSWFVSFDGIGDQPITYRWEIQRIAAGVAGPWLSLSDGIVDGLGTVAGATTQGIQISNAAPGIRFSVRVFITNPCNEFVFTVDGLFSYQCNSIDFNQNGVFPEDQDVIDFFNVLAGAECPTCNDIDFNNNTVFPEDQDVIDFFTVLAGGTCS